jgi:hypothetical protein
MALDPAAQRRFNGYLTAMTDHRGTSLTPRPGA